MTLSSPSQLVFKLIDYRAPYIIRPSQGTNLIIFPELVQRNWAFRLSSSPIPIVRIQTSSIMKGVSTRSGFPVFGQNREPEPGYPGSLFWATGTKTGTLVKPGSRLPAGSGCTRSGNRFFNKIIFGLIFGIGPKIYKLYV
jgi:hypothetical protein